MTSPRKSMWYPKEEKEEQQTRKVVHDFVLVFFLCKLYDSWRHYFMQLDYVQKIEWTYLWDVVCSVHSHKYSASI